MFSHVTLGTNDLQRAIRFYDGVMAVLGYKKHSTGDTFAGYGNPDNASLGVNSLWILIPADGQPATSGNGTNVAFLASAREKVEEFHRKALELGGVDEGRPGIREEAHPNFYASYIRDPDGNKLVVVCHHPVS
jgi:catechol 2,3-dioxygenase-like lactoylglutathione lyase family enzyme